MVVANGEEGEPSSFKDRWLLTNRPHAVIDGLLLAAAAIGADRAVIYLSHPETVLSVRKAVAESPSLPGRVAVEIHVVEPRYVAGEETAVCRAINGGPALPFSKPPRPFESGVGRGLSAPWRLRSALRAHARTTHRGLRRGTERRDRRRARRRVVHGSGGRLAAGRDVVL